MLILRRKAGETLLIGDSIKVAVLDINEGSVRLAIDAPKSISILRSELLQAADANRDAAQEHSRPQELLKLMRGKGTPPAGHPAGGQAAPAKDAAPDDASHKESSGSTS